MKKGFIALISVLLGVMIQAPSVLAGTLVEFEGGIGVLTVDGLTTQTCSTNCTVNRNDVRGIQPGGQPWVIRKFEAKVKDNGDIRAEAKGLVLAGGNNIGTTGGVATVFATLFCGTPPGTPHDSAAVPLEVNGDFRIKGTLTPTPPD